MKASGVAIQRLTTTEEHCTHDQKGHNGEHFNKRKPELHLRKPFHTDHIHGANDGTCSERKDPLRHAAKRTPVMHIQSDGGNINNPRHRPVDEVHPASNISGFLTQKLTGIRDKTATGRAV